MANQEKAHEIPAEDVSAIEGLIKDHTIMNLHRRTVPSMNPPKLSDGAVVISERIAVPSILDDVDIDTTESMIDRENARFFAEQLLSGQKKDVKIMSSTSREPNDIWCIRIRIMGRNDEFAHLIQGGREAVSQV
jgi:hypothetical protein